MQTEAMHAHSCFESWCFWPHLCPIQAAQQKRGTLQLPGSPPENQLQTAPSPTQDKVSLLRAEKEARGWDYCQKAKK